MAQRRFIYVCATREGSLEEEVVGKQSFLTAIVDMS